MMKIIHQSLRKQKINGSDIYLYMMGKKDKYGDYICAVGYLSVRQKIDMPRKKKLNNGEFQTIPGKVEVFVYHTKHKMAGPYGGKEEALIKAEEMVKDGVKYDRYRK